jgi:ABC-type lipoprotein export system ATPase subunit
LTAYPRGSEWRRWDLHIHTPLSTLNNAYEGDFDVYVRRVLQEAASRKIAAIGITDYFSVAGYRHFREHLEDDAWLDTLPPDVSGHARSMLVLANVELRGFVIGGADGPDSRVNYHILFADDLTADEIETHFLSQLRFTAAGLPGGNPERMPLADANFEMLGERLKAEHPQFAQSPLHVGMMNAVVDHEEATKVLNDQRTRFEGKYFLVAPIDEDLADLPWDNQGHLTRKVFIQNAHMIFSSNRSTREFALGLKHPTVEAYLAEFVSKKPCIHGSDAHSYDRLFEPDERRFNWIKADPTWRGLAMLLNEPADRVYIGPRPPQLEAVERRQANTITSISISRTPQATTAERWFDNTVLINAGTSAIIGNRGNGKSALAEIVGLLGDTQRTDAFSFLSPDRFRSERIGKADQFHASISWGDGSMQGPRRLSDDPPTTSVERVRYIGQGYLEEICNEMDRGESSRFYQELQDVIFSHVSPADRQGHTTLRSLLEAIGTGIEQTIAALRDDIRNLNRRILDYTQQLEPTNRQRLQARLDEVNRQLAAHDAARPPEVPPPTDPAITADERALQEEAARVRTAITELDARIAAARREDVEVAGQRAAALRLIDRVRAVEAAIRGFKDEGADDARVAGIDIDAVVEIRIDLAAIEETVRRSDARRNELRIDLDVNAEGATKRQAQTRDRLARLEERLSLPQRQHQEYLNALSTWQRDRALLIGDVETANTVLGLQAQIEALDGLPAAIAELSGRRRAKASEIYAAKSRLRGQFEELHSPVSTFLEASEVAASEAFKLRFSAQVAEYGFADTFLGMIDQRRLGPFAGVDEGTTALNQFLSGVDWSSVDAVANFVERIAAVLTDDGARPLADQLRQGFTPQQLLDFLFGLEYVTPTYRLTWDGRSVSELSPGERGNLLLIFYLLVDRDDIPLVIDQPEENLDNQTVYKTLVPCMRDARLRRQVIVVTHNPNLAVVCDADQIIYAEMRKDGTNTVIYESGSIEDPGINRRLVDVLEGTKPAFDQRAAAYLLP